MKRLMSGTVLLGAVLAAGACNNVTSDLSGNATRIIATPTFLVTDTVQLKSVLVQTFDDQGMPVVGAATVGTVTGVIAAAVDPNYRPGGQAVVTKIDVTGNALGVGSFTTTANGLTTTVNVDVQPPADNLVGAYTLVNPGPPVHIGDTILFTTPASEPYRFIAGSTPFVGLTSVAGNIQQVLYISTDSLTMGILAVDTTATGVAGAPSVTSAILTYAPTIGTYRVVTDTFAQPAIDILPPTIPAAPAGVVATAFSPDSVHLNWTLAGGVNPYQISRGSTTGGPYTVIGFTSNAPLNQFGDLTPPFGQNFYVVQGCVTQFTGAETANYCSPASAEVTATVVPPTPAGLAAAVAAPDSVNLTWTAVPRVPLYKVLRGTVTGGPYAQIGTANTAKYSDLTGVSGTPYFYVVQACGAPTTVCSGNSNEATATAP